MGADLGSSFSKWMLRWALMSYLGENVRLWLSRAKMQQETQTWGIISKSHRMMCSDRKLSKFMPLVINTNLTAGLFAFICSKQWMSSTVGECFCVSVFSSASDWTRTRHKLWFFLHVYEVDSWGPWIHSANSFWLTRMPLRVSLHRLIISEPVVFGVVLQYIEWCGEVFLLFSIPLVNTQHIHVWVGNLFPGKRGSIWFSH